MILYISLIATTILVILFTLYSYKLKKENKGIIFNDLFWLFISVLIQIVGITLQALLTDILNIKPVYYEYISYIGGVFLPVFLLILAIHFNNEKKDSKKLRILYIVPIITLLILWTNDFHNLFYYSYSTIISDTIFGGFFSIYSIYSYLCMFISVILLVSTSLRKSGFFSIQTALFVFGILIPLVPNILATFKIISMTVHITPILFSITTIFFAIAIIKYKALNITPVAFRTIIDTMSDAYIVISKDGTIVDTNKTFRNIFNGVLKFDIDENLYKALRISSLMDVEELKKHIHETRKKGNIVTQEYHMKQGKFDRYFEVDFHPISSKSNSKDYVGTLLLFKDITQHKLDIMQIEEKQEIIVKQGQLVSIGELAGGVAHDINTPISAIKTGILMLNQMNDSRSEEEKQIIERMDNCATKIINIVNSMRNQIRNLGGDSNIEFKISEVINDVKVITFHEAKKNKSEVIVDVKDDLKIKGDPTKLGQVLTNLVVNGIQAYGENESGKVEITVSKEKSKVALIKVQDFAGGLDESIIPYVFKNILTTKGTNGTGLGLYLAYSVIKGNFNGEITFDTKKGEGTSFYIRIPIEK